MRALIFLLWLTPLIASDMETSNALYDKGEFAQAVKGYTDLLPSTTSGHLFYNLGNAYWRLKDGPSAMSAYLAARELMPRDKDIQANIQLVSAQNSDKIQPQRPQDTWSWAAGLLFMFSAYEYQLLALALTLCCVLCAVLSLFLPRLKTFAATSLMAALLGTLGLGLRVNLAEAWAVVKEDVSVMSGPTDFGTKLFALHSGAPVMVKRQVADWYEVILSDGKKGWLPLAKVVTHQASLIAGR